MTLRRLENIARFYIERFATTTSHLRRVLARRAERALKAHGGDKKEVAVWIDQVVDRLVRLKLVDDARFAADRAATLRRMGRGPGRINAILAAKGVPRAIIKKVIAETEETASGCDASLMAAVAYVKRRRFGNYGKDAADRAAQSKKGKRELAALGRAGFSYAVACRALKTSEEDA